MPRWKQIIRIGEIEMLKPLAVSALALCCFGSVTAQSADIPPDYAYPYQDPWLATASVAFLKDPKLPEKQVKDATIYPARARTPLFEDKAKVYYVTYRQEKPADLVVLLSGLGSVAEDPLALYLGGQIFAMGYNVLVLPNAFNWQFALGASRSGYPGVPSVDAGDLENFIVRARDHAVKVDGMKIRQTKLVGYSMGALEGAFLAAREAEHPRLKFDKVVLLNPPVDTFYDLHQLDALAETGKDWPADEKKTVKARAFDLVMNANLTDPQGAPYFTDLAQKNTLTDDQLKYVLFGLFHGSLTDVIMVSQQIKDEGILKSPASTVSLDAREKEAGQYGFTDYLNKFVLPQLGGPAAAEKLKGETLYGLHDFLASHHEVEIFHNADDFLVRPQDVAYLQSTLTNRLTLFPHGGHMGNIWYPTNQLMLAQALERGPVDPPPAPPPPPAAIATDTAVPPADGSAAPAVDAAAAPAAPAPNQAAAPPLPTPGTETAQTAPAQVAQPLSVVTPSAPMPGPNLAQTAPTPLAPPAPVTAAVTPPPAPAEPPPADTAQVPVAPTPTGPAPDSALSPPGAPVSPPAAVAAPAEDPLAVAPQPETTTITTTTTGPSPSPSYTIKIPPIPSATPASPPPP